MNKLTKIVLICIIGGILFAGFIYHEFRMNNTDNQIVDLKSNLENQLADLKSNIKESPVADLKSNIKDFLTCIYPKDVNTSDEPGILMIDPDVWYDCINKHWSD